MLMSSVWGRLNLRMWHAQEAEMWGWSLGVKNNKVFGAESHPRVGEMAKGKSETNVCIYGGEKVEEPQMD